MKKNRLAAVLPAALLLLASCASPGAGKDYHTMYTGDGTNAPETVIITLPAETVIVTVPVEVTGAPETKAPEVTTGTAVITDAPVTEATTAPVETAEPSLLTVKYETAVKDLGSGSSATYIYPVISGLSSETVATKLNSNLSNLAEFDFIADEHCKDYSEKIKNGNKVAYKVTSCDVTRVTSTLISVRMTAEYTVTGSDKVELIFAHYMSLTTGKEIKSKDVFSNFAKILDQLEATKNKTGASGNFDSSTDISGIIKQYRAGIAYNTYPVTYLTGSELVIAVSSAGQSGGYAEYSIPLSSIGDCFKITF